MMANVVKKGWIVALLGIAAAALLFVGSMRSDDAEASSSGTTIVPLLSCPNVDGSMESGTGGVRIGDILTIVQAYFKDYPSTNYVYMYDLANPYNPENGAGGQQRVDDILAVVGAYFDDCPLVDTQVAQAVRWAIDMDGNPGNGNQSVPQTESEAGLEAIGYYRTTTDVPGQGVHYVNLSNWDGIFNPAAPEGLVYNNGRLAAQLYVADADTVGLGTHAPGPCSSGCPGAEYNIELETAADGPQCNPACSWNGAETWHLHHYLCSAHIGTPSAIAIPGSFVPSVGGSDAQCATYAGEPQCTIPITTQPCYRWSLNSGWMGHLYAWYPNNNLVPDVNATMNGRFADCFPDTENWKATNCPG